MNSTINDLKEILNENDYPDVKFTLIAHKKGKNVVFEYELNQPDMWFYIYPTLIKAKLNDWSQELSFIESEVITNILRKGIY